MARKSLTFNLFIILLVLNLFQDFIPSVQVYHLI